jgi:Ca2+/Na+ antiporter
MVGASNAYQRNNEVSGSGGFIVAIFMLVAGIIGMVTRNSKKGGMTAAVFYFIGGIIGNAIPSENYSDLKVWGILSLIFSTIFVLGSINMIKPLKETEVTTENAPAKDNNESEQS